MDESLLSELITRKIKQWHQSQQGQTDGYEYERSFNEMIQSIGKDILQQSIGTLPGNHKLKKTSHLVRDDRSSAGSLYASRGWVFQNQSFLSADDLPRRAKRSF